MAETAALHRIAGRGRPPPGAGLRRFLRFRAAAQLPAITDSSVDELNSQLAQWFLYEIFRAACLPVGHIDPADRDAKLQNILRPDTVRTYVNSTLKSIALIYDIALTRPEGLDSVVRLAKQQQRGCPAGAKFAASVGLLQRAADDAEAAGEHGLRAALLVGFSGLLRVGEYTSASALRFDPDEDPCVGDVRFDTAVGRERADFTIRHRKSDEYNRGTTVDYFSTDGDDKYDVVAALRRATGGRAADEPLFIRADGRRCVTAAAVSDAVKAAAKAIGLDPSRFASHSLRIGGATRLVSLGVPFPLVKLRGGWASDVFLQYCRASLGTSLGLAEALSISNPRPYSATVAADREADANPLDAARFMFNVQGAIPVRGP